MAELCGWERGVRSGYQKIRKVYVTDAGILGWKLVIYRKDRELFLENPATHEANKVFEGDVIINVDVSSDIVTLWDVKNEELDHSHTVILP